MTTTEASLGAFAPERGRMSRAAAAGVALASAGALAGAARAALDAADPSGDHRGVGRAALFLAVAGATAALVGAYGVAARGFRGRGTVKAALAVAGIAAAFAYVYAGAHEGTLRLDRFADRFLDLDLLGRVSGDLARGALNTLKLAAVAEVLSLALGLVVATLRISPRRWVRLPAVWYVDVVRGTPLLVLIALIYGGLPSLGVTLSAFMGAAAALTLNAGAYVAEIFRAGIQAVPRGQSDAARSLGMPHAMTMLVVVIPQAVRSVIPPLMSEFIALVKDTAIVVAFTGFTVATADLFGAARTTAASTFSPTPYVGATLGYLIITIPLIRLVGYAERRVRSGLA